jgi:tetrapyrrole methylase family protein/MazG family protein
MGDLLFSVVNLCRFLKVEAELTLAQTINRFVKRFSYIESRLRAQGKSLSETPLAEMDSLWEEAKDQS